MTKTTAMTATTETVIISILEFLFSYLFLVIYDHFAYIYENDIVSKNLRETHTHTVTSDRIENMLMRWAIIQNNNNNNWQTQTRNQKSMNNANSERYEIHRYTSLARLRYSGSASRTHTDAFSPCLYSFYIFRCTTIAKTILIISIIKYYYHHFGLGRIVAIYSMQLNNANEGLSHRWRHRHSNTMYTKRASSISTECNWLTCYDYVCLLASYSECAPCSHTYGQKQPTTAATVCAAKNRVVWVWKKLLTT